MSRKRRQRSTSIRKRIEKKQREQEKNAKRRAKRGGAGEDEFLVRMVVPRQHALACSSAISDLEQRLAGQPIRGWTTADLGGDHGLSWLGSLLSETLGSQPEANALEVDLLSEAKQPLLDRLSSLEMAAPGLEVDWDEAFAQVTFALGQAEEPEEEEDEPEASGEDVGDDEASDEASDEEPGLDETAEPAV